MSVQIYKQVVTSVIADEHVHVYLIVSSPQEIVHIRLSTESYNTV